MALNHNTDMLYTRSGATESNVLSAHDPLIWEFEDTALVGGPATATVQFVVKDNDLAVIYTSVAFPAYQLSYVDPLAKFRFDGTQILKHIIKNYFYKEISTIIDPENYGSTVDIVFRTYDNAVENANDTVTYYLSQAVNQIGDEYGSNIPRLFLNDTEDIAHFLGYPTKIFFYLATDRSAHSPLIEIIDRDITESENLINSLANNGGFNDWFLPSKDEMNEMYINLHLFGVGGFGTETYWNSTEYDATNAYIYNFGNGNQGWAAKDNPPAIYDVRACRTFTAGVGDYSLRDTGPAGGLIFYIDGTTYYEAAPVNQSGDYRWSNIDNVLIGTTSANIGEGQNNTNEIIAQAGHTDSAAKLCDDSPNYETFIVDETSLTSVISLGLAQANSSDFALVEGENYLVIIPALVNNVGELPLFYLYDLVALGEVSIRLRAVVGDNAFILKSSATTATGELRIRNEAACDWECGPIQVIPVEDASDYGSMKIGVHCIDLGLLALSKKSIYARMYYDHDAPVKIKDYNLSIFEACENAIFIRWLNSNGDYSYWAFSPYPFRNKSGNRLGSVINNFTEMALANSRNLPLGYRDAFDKISVIASAVPLLFRRKMLEIFTSPAVYLWNGIPSENLISALSNSVSNPYDTFTSDGIIILSAINTGVDTQFALSDTFTVTQGEKIIIFFFLALHSGVVPFSVRIASTTAIVSNSVGTAEGFNFIELTVTADATANIQILATDPTSFSTSEIVVKRKEIELDWILLNRVEGSHNLMLKKDTDNFECTLVLPENYTQQLSGQNI